MGGHEERELSSVFQVLPQFALKARGIVSMRGWEMRWRILIMQSEGDEGGICVVAESCHQTSEGIGLMASIRFRDDMDSIMTTGGENYSITSEEKYPAVYTRGRSSRMQSVYVG